jgi:hypothetical protein
VFERCIRKMDELFTLSQDQPYFAADLARVTYAYSVKLTQGMGNPQLPGNAVYRDTLLRTRESSIQDFFGNHGSALSSSLGYSICSGPRE